MNMLKVAGLSADLTQANRPIRLRLAYQNTVLEDVLLVKQVSGQETLCGGLEYRLLCIASEAALPLKALIALPVALEFVTDRGQLRAVNGIVAQACAGQSDGGLATYQLLMRDGVALMEQRTNTRVFRNLSEIDIVRRLVRDRRDANAVLAACFDIDTSGVTTAYPAREFTMQYDESDAAFLRRLLKRRGIAWFIRPGAPDKSRTARAPTHTLVLFDAPSALAINDAGSVRFHRDAGTEARDGIFNWSAVRQLSVGNITRQSWDYQQGRMMTIARPTTMQQGEAGDQFACSLNDYQLDAPHVADDSNDYRSLGELRIQRHEFDAKCFYGESGVRDLGVGLWFALDGHPEIDTHPRTEREFVVTALSVVAENNLPKDIDERAQRLFSANAWSRNATEVSLEQASAARGKGRPVAKGPNCALTKQWHCVLHA